MSAGLATGRHQDGGVYHPWNNRVDISSSVFPCACELKNFTKQYRKGHWDALAQALRRLKVLTETRAYLKRVVIFTLAPPVCNVILATSTIEDNQMTWQVQVLSLTMNRLLPLWAALQSHAVKSPSWYLHPQAMALRHVVQKLWAPVPNVHQPSATRSTDCEVEVSPVMPLCYFCVQFKAVCASSVVFIISPTNLIEPDTQYCCLRRNGASAIAVKVFRNTEDYTNEITSLTRMTDWLKDHGPGEHSRLVPSRFYALAHADLEGENTDLMWFNTVPEGDRQPRQLPVVPEVRAHLQFNNHYRATGAEEVWWGAHDIGQEFAHVLVMRVGESALDRYNAATNEQRPDISEQVFFGVTSCLEALHLCGRVHRDVRAPNMMFFGDEVQLIDYGFSCAVENTDSEAPSVAVMRLGRQDAELSWPRSYDMLLARKTLQLFFSN